MFIHGISISQLRYQTIDLFAIKMIKICQTWKLLFIEAVSKNLLKLKILLKIVTIQFRFEIGQRGACLRSIGNFFHG